MARSLNRVQLIGNLTRDPELRYTPSGAAVCSFSIATNRSWTTDSGEKHDEADFHRIVAWNKLAELCSQFLVKGRKVYVEGRLSTRSYNASDGTPKSITEIVISDMILLDSKRPDTAAAAGVEVEAEEVDPSTSSGQGGEKSEKKSPKRTDAKIKKEKEEVASGGEEEPIALDDIPF